MGMVDIKWVGHQACAAGGSFAHCTNHTHTSHFHSRISRQANQLLSESPRVPHFLASVSESLLDQSFSSTRSTSTATMADVQNVEQFAPLKKMIAANGDILAGEQNGDNNSGLVDSFLTFVGKNGLPEGFSWEDVKAVIVAKFDEVTKKFEAENPIASQPSVANVDNYTFAEYRTRILENLNRFEDAPFTLGRICELLREPRKHYDRGDKFLRAFEKCVTVTSTNGTSDSTTNGTHTNGNGENGHQTATNGHSTSTNGDAPMETDATVNGDSATTTATATESNGSDVTTTNGHTTTNGSDVTAATNGDVTSKTADSDVTTTNGDDVTAKTDGDVTAVGEEKTSQKRPNEDVEGDTVAKKMARIENGTLNGASGHAHTVVGEPEVEPQQEGEGKKGDVVGDASQAVVLEKDEVDVVPVVGQEAAV